MTLRLAWFTAGRGAGSRGMFERAVSAIADGSLNAEIAVVFIQRERGEGEGSDAFMDRARSLGIPVETLSARRWRAEHGGTLTSPVRAAYDQALWAQVAPHAPQVGVLAGYLLIMSPELTRSLPFVNLHPALPEGPVGLWQKVVAQLISEGTRETGSTVFRVTEELDRGPSLAYTRVGLRGPGFDALWADPAAHQPADEGGALFDAIRAAGVRREPELLVQTLRALADGRMGIEDRTRALDLTAQVEAALDARS
ncbi:MAG: formyltransferase family protein [Chloroflexota bacterium]